jgi:peptide/nickel transport system substrate-binding protein
LDPLYLEGIFASEIGEFGFSYLTSYDANGAIVPDVAREVPTMANQGISADGKRVTFHLRHGVVWEDGTPLTSRDVVFTYRAVMNPRDAIPSRYGYDRISLVRAPDPYTVVVTTRTPYSPIVSNFLGGDSSYPILPAHLLAQYASLNRVPFNGAPIGSGPYRFGRWVHGDRVTLMANPSYFGGRPGIDRIDLRFVSDPSTIVNQLSTGEIDATFFADPANIATLRQIPNRRILVTPVPFGYSLDFNLTDPAIGDAKVRRAFAFAIDRPTAVRKAFHGIYDASTGMRALFNWAFDPRAGNVPYAPQAAAALLTSDGWITGADGIRSKMGHRLTIRLIDYTGIEGEDELATIIAAQERAVGIDVTRQRYSRQVFFSLAGPFYSERYQVALYYFQSTLDPDVSWEFGCNQRPPNGFNTPSYCNRAVDRALAHAVTVFDRKSRLRDYSFVQHQILKDLPYYFLCQLSEIDVIPSSLRGYERPLLSPFNSVARWRYAGIGNQRQAGLSQR